MISVLFSLICLLLIKNEPRDVGLPNIDVAAAKKSKGGETAASGVTVEILSVDVQICVNIQHVPLVLGPKSVDSALAVPTSRDCLCISG